jgi:hypothetical protein
MKKFSLTTKEGEVINTISTSDINTAISYFTIQKQLFPEQLLEIYNVIESEEGNTGNA